MEKQVSPEKRRQYLDVKYTIASNGTYTPNRFDAYEEQYPIETLCSKEVEPGKWQYTVQLNKKEFYLYRTDDQWWVE